MSAGVGNDVVGWILLALTVALVNAGSGLTALYVLLTSVGYVIFLMYPVRWTFLYLARRTGSLETGQPTAFMMTITLLVVFISAFFTDVIGVHAIFGESHIFRIQISISDLACRWLLGRSDYPP